MTPRTKKRIVDACGYIAILGALIVYNWLEREYGDYVAVGGALLLLIPIGILWRIAYWRLASDLLKAEE